tara:strand:+ start:1535 stop:2212 length:678 start_codon:yes stop_codon:yes gene_type:complete
MPVDIHGKQYATVNERIIELHNDYKGSCSIVTKIVESDSGTVRVKATLTLVEMSEGLVSHSNTYTGHAEEVIGSSMINKTSALENAETSAVGRALAFAGFSTDASIASADEVANAIINQNNTPSTKQKAQDNQVDNTDYDNLDWKSERENALTFGKNKGTAWKDIEDGYLAWLAGKKDGKNARFADLEQNYRIVMQPSNEQENKEPEPKKIESVLEEHIQDLFDE